MGNYIPFTEQQREQARRTDLAAFLRQCGEEVILSLHGWIVGKKDKTVGNGQHGTARWATRQAAKNGNQPTANGEPLIARPKVTYDGAMPSGNSVAAMVLQNASIGFFTIIPIKAEGEPHGLPQYSYSKAAFGASHFSSGMPFSSKW